jgi:GTP pyrophosphokinase
MFRNALLASFLVAPTLLQDISFRLLDPNNHAAMSMAVAPDAHDDQDSLDMLIADSHALLSVTGVDGEVQGRLKSLLSTHHKMQRKTLSLDQVHDRIAVRLIVPTVDEAYAVRDALGQLYATVPGTDRDYIASPKDNGYQSLHASIQVPGLDRTAEFQIRTPQMHEAAESGEAAHWRYKLIA